LPHLALKWGPASLNGQRIENAEFSREVPGERIGKPVRIPCSLKQKSVRAKLPDQLPTDGLLILCEESNPQTPCRVADQHHRANGRGKPINKEMERCGHERRS
jgi:hypothetical protein